MKPRMSHDQTTTARDWFTRIVTVAALALALMVVFLARQNRELKRRLGEPAAPVDALEPGERLGPVRLVDADGRTRPLTLAEDGGPTVLLFFTPTCPACRETLPVWRSIVASLEAPASVLGVDLAPPGSPGAREALGADDWPFPVVRVDPEGSAGLARIAWVPATVIVGGDGVVQRVWFGALDEAGQDELRGVLGRTVGGPAAADPDLG